jgi:hypothetical protein
VGLRPRVLAPAAPTHLAWVVRNQIGIVLRRYKNATVILKAKDGFCAAVPASVGQPHQGRGKFGPKYGVDEFLEATPVKCP